MNKRYQPRKCTNPVKAIREHCIECMGGRGTGQNYRQLISECIVKVCAFYEFRFGVNPYHKPKISDKQRKVMSDRAKSSSLIGRAVRKTRSNLRGLGKGEG
jgi:hypothetical protein